MTLPHCLIAGQRLISAHDAEVLVPWWSFTKTVIAAAALALVRDGRLDLDEPQRDRPFTLRHLLQHRAGVPDYGDLAEYHEAVARGGEPWPFAEMLARTDAGRLRYVPGTSWDYSNIGYGFAGQAIEHAAGEPLDRALNRLVCAPLGIHNARLATTRDQLDGVRMASARDYHPGWVYHGLLVGPVSEAAWLLHRLMTTGFLPAPLLEAMTRAHGLGGPIAGRPWLTPGYGLGLMAGAVSGGLQVAGHTGGGPGSVIAVYHAAEPARTVAAAGAGVPEAAAEAHAFRLLQPEGAPP